MSLIQTDVEIVRDAVPLAPPTGSPPARLPPSHLPPSHLPSRPSAGRIVAAVALAGAGLLLGVIAGIVIVFSTGLVAFC